MEYLELTPEEAAKADVYEAVGCQRCNGTGYFDRTGVYEMMEISSDLRHMIARRASTDELRDTAMNAGMRTLHQSAKRLVLEGITNVAEMQRISVSDLSLMDDITPQFGGLE